MICYIFGAAPVPCVDQINIRISSDDVVICADGGYHLAQRLGIKPDWVVGDFDSLDIIPPVPNIRRFNPVKDDTDLRLAIEQGRMLGYCEFIIYGALGGRLDHSMAVVQLLHAMTPQGLNIRVIGQDAEMTCLHNGSMTISNNGQNQLFSVFSLSASSTGVFITGARYPLDDAALSYDVPLGVSNQIIDQNAIIRVQNGVLLIVFADDLHQNNISGIR